MLNKGHSHWIFLIILPSPETLAIRYSPKFYFAAMLQTASASDTLPDLLQRSAFLAELAEKALPTYLPRQRWFMSKGKQLTSCRITHAFGINDYTALLLVDVDFGDGATETYQLPLAWNTEPEWLDFFDQFNDNLIVARLGDPLAAILSDAVPRANFRHHLFTELREERERPDALTYDRGKLLTGIGVEVSSTVPAIDTSNTAIIYNDAFFFKLFRKVDPGLNPDLELTRFLSERTTFDNSPAYGGSISVGSMDDDHFINLGVMIAKIDNRGDAWEFFQELAEEYYRSVLSRLASDPATPTPAFTATDRYDDLEASVRSVLAERTFDRARLLGKRTAEMHLALASAAADNQDMATEPLTAAYREEIYRAATKLVERQFTELDQKLDTLSADQRAEAENVLARREEVMARFAALRERDMETALTRIHGDYHLGQVLVTDDDFYIIDFEGEPLLSIPERRRKRPPFKDVAGMVRSFHYAAQGQLLLNNDYTAEERRQLVNWGELWFRHLRHAFLVSYLETAGSAAFVPADPAEREDLLDFFVLEKAVYEVAYELNSRPDWLSIPLRGVLFALIDNRGE